MRLDFIVLNWNQEALDYYHRLGAVDLTREEKWHLYRINSEYLKQLSERSHPS